MPLEISKDEITSDEKTKKSLMKRQKNKGFKWCYFAWPFFVLSGLFFVIYVISCCAICYFVFSPSVISSFLFFSAWHFCFISSICLALFCLFYRAITPGRKTEKTKKRNGTNQPPYQRQNAVTSVRLETRQKSRV